MYVVLVHILLFLFVKIYFKRFARMMIFGSILSHTKKRRTTRPQNVVVLTFSLVAEDARTLEFCYLVRGGVGLQNWRGRSQFLPLQKRGGLKKFNHAEKGAKYFHHLKRGALKVLPCLERVGGVGSLGPVVSHFKGPPPSSQ